jgi:hypothetical protein
MHPGIEIDRDFPLSGIAALELAVMRREATADYCRNGRSPMTRCPTAA